MGGATLYLGTDDQDGSTTVSGVDLYPDPLAHLSRIEGDHPFQFYRKLGLRPGRDHPRCQWPRSAGHPHGETDRQSPEAG